ncbi:hypothetical protein A2634_02395 [Candidatus Amesbacteria bacterium RIFCSPHIGHO2_01_FULL_48_32]|uniref:Uncharacterized protein n=1 Tax=Candidatus Amesbacteria bacterium RIFCSPLOWO2_01_FULL_48_25 TaxID=1797259 RepID=A0A1F4ZDQ0_9BACT|nr:MAG: hypothetical protein A2634_02395 [Candidatus Amesbacteria bacterium RIFCSPHIGHO2_01_FULL_48_32]OGD04433.1 MAG: hypothetical protein A2989_05395 [Candidatus Amesbacteria bacterium RIFCSPLOWO2_01_FULL_48_25]HJZ06277.1 hypothetical protein [Patescibacteria group bacterium]
MKKWVGVFLAAGLVMATGVGASEGTADIFSLRGRRERCFLASVLMPSGNYKVIMSCRDMIFPPEQFVYGYAVWINPVEGGDPIKLGSLGVGKGEYGTKKAFSSVYISEDRPIVREGTRKIFPPALMQGEMKPLNIWASDVIAEPTATPGPTVVPTLGEGERPADQEQAQSVRERLGAWVTRILGVLFGVGLLVVLAAVIVMSVGGRKRYPPGV